MNPKKFAEEYNKGLMGIIDSVADVGFGSDWDGMRAPDVVLVGVAKGVDAACVAAIQAWKSAPASVKDKLSAEEFIYCITLGEDPAVTAQAKGARKMGFAPKTGTCKLGAEHMRCEDDPCFGCETPRAPAQ